MKLINKIFKKQNPIKFSKLINQRYRHDCSIACIAMFVGKSYDDIKDKYFPTRDFNFRTILNIEFEAIMYDMGIQIKEDEGFDSMVDSIVILASLNDIGKYHAVYWDSKDQKVYDPQRGLKDGDIPRKFYTTDTFLESEKLSYFYSY